MLISASFVALSLMSSVSVADPDASPASAPPGVNVSLAPATEASAVRLQWSPKGAKVALTPEGDSLVGSIRLGPKGTPPIALRLERSSGSPQFDRLWIDLDRDGDADAADDADEHRSTTPTERRGKWWSSFSATVTIAVPPASTPGTTGANGDRPGAAASPTAPSPGAPSATPTTPTASTASPATSRPYPINLWFVADPLEPDAEPALRWSRRGWHEGSCTIGGLPAYVLVTDRAMDGIFDRQDSWMLARDPKDLGRASRSLAQHAWLDGAAYLPISVDPHGRAIRLEPFDPGVTEAQEREKADIYRVDREAPRATTPLVFGHDLDAALVAARAQVERGEGRGRVFVDFETTWCGPCKQMDQWVYPAAAVVQAAEGLQVVKLDGDEQRELVKRYAVRGYPTMLMLDADGAVLDRLVGYRSVAEMARFLGGN
ncbi:MAG: thioredoxin family protein [Phycisphaerales bacterium]